MKCWCGSVLVGDNQCQSRRTHGAHLPAKWEPRVFWAGDPPHLKWDVVSRRAGYIFMKRAPIFSTLEDAQAYAGKLNLNEADYE